jgi:carbamoyl-phosphate synthase large subunit
VPATGNVFISVRDNDKAAILPVARALVALEFSIYATTATAASLQEAGVACELINKISQGRPHILDKVQDGQISWIINTSLGRRTTEDSYLIRRAALDYHIPYTTTVSGAAALVKGLQELKKNKLVVHPVQNFTQPR